jgi:hypothetical protein
VISLTNKKIKSKFYLSFPYGRNNNQGSVIIIKTMIKVIIMMSIVEWLQGCELPPNL